MFTKHLPHHLGLLIVTIVASAATLFLVSSADISDENVEYSSAAIAHEKKPTSDEQLVLAFHLKTNQNEDLKLYNDDLSRGIEPVTIDLVQVSSTTKAALATDSYLGGAYNIPATLYRITGEGKDRIVSEATLIDTDTKGAKIRPQDSRDGDEITFDVYNAGFDPEDHSFHVTGFRAFGIYPCNYDQKYEFYNDRFILTSISQAKGCKGIEIEDPTDIPDNFDPTPVEIYSISSQTLKKAQEISLN